MQLTSKELFPNCQEVDVVLATFNGELFIREQLESIKCQSGVRVNLYLSDDGSTDSTLKIVSEYEEAFNSIELFEGPRKGPAANFFFLLRQTKGKYVAFSDQDDIWDSDHLVNSIGDLDKFDGIPALRFSATEEFGEISRFKSASTKITIPHFQSLIFRNPMRGCSMVINRLAANEINSYEPKLAVMHDWWILLQIYVKGVVIFTTRSEVAYRLHSANFTKRTPKLGYLKIKKTRKKVYDAFQQAQELHSQVMHITPNESINALRVIAELHNCSFVSKLRLLIFNRQRFRPKLIEELFLRALILTIPATDLKKSN